VSPSEPFGREAWARINDLFHRALDRPADEREAFLVDACDDAAIRDEVVSLLASHGRAGDFIESAVARVGSGKPSTIPERIGPYRVRHLLGEGGMGVVYVADDMRLGRTVALKALAPQFVGDAMRRERLRREARAAAALTHPGIATVYALEEIEGHLYIAGELIQGKTLREELEHGPLDPRRAIETAAAIARALAAAHERGIVHRDLKPENVMRTPAGDVKILDFGLARFPDVASSVTNLSADGAILGTPAYMSPEQIRGDFVDARSDLFSLGTMLYELVTGVHPFKGSGTASTIARILQSEPAAMAAVLRQPTPPGFSERPSGSFDRHTIADLETIVFRCLSKDPEDRFASAGDLAAALDDLQRGTADAGPTTRVPRRLLRHLDRAFWWWQFHQAAAVLGYVLLLIPLWRVRDLTPGPRGTLLFVGGLVGVVIAGALRLHLWFAVRLDRDEWQPQHRQSARWMLAGDLLFVGTLAMVGILALAMPEPRLWGVLLVAAAAAVLVSRAVIEPATARAAFGSGTDRRPN
jgi:serine/threonine protein kinase